MDAPLDSAALDRLRWRCRRGMLENDLLLDRFFRRLRDRGETITSSQADALMALMDLPDNDLLDLLLSRTEPRDPLDRREVHALLTLLRRPRPTDD